MPSMDMVCRFCGADPESDDSVLGACLNAAIAWYERAGVPADAWSGNDLYEFWVCNLAAWFYDNRGAGGENAVVPPYIVASKHQFACAPTTGGGA